MFSQKPRSELCKKENEISLSCHHVGKNKDYLGYTVVFTK